MLLLSAADIIIGRFWEAPIAAREGNVQREKHSLLDTIASRKLNSRQVWYAVILCTVQAAESLFCGVCHPEVDLLLGAQTATGFVA